MKKMKIYFRKMTAVKVFKNQFNIETIIFSLYIRLVFNYIIILESQPVLRTENIMLLQPLQRCVIQNKNFFHRKALLSQPFLSVTSPLVTFRKFFFSRDTLRVILDLMTSVLSFYHVRGRENGQSHRQTNFEYYTQIYFIFI